MKDLWRSLRLVQNFPQAHQTHVFVVVEVVVQVLVEVVEEVVHECLVMV